MLNIFLGLIDIILPAPKSVKEIRRVKGEIFKHQLDIKKFTKNITFLSSYNSLPIRYAVTANKFHNYPHASKLLSILLKDYLATLPAKKIILVPIPLSGERQKKRGYNQVQNVIGFTIDKSQIISLPLLEKKYDTIPQTKLNREQRLKNMIDTFSFCENYTDYDFSNTRIILLDDVLTTGATLNEALKVLKINLPRDCELLGVALAH